MSGVRKFTLGEIGPVRMCKRIMKDETSPDGEIPFFKIGTFGGKADVFISRERYEEYKSKYPYPKRGDVLISAAGTIGRLVVFDGRESYFQDSNIVWVENDEAKVTNACLYYALQLARWKPSQGSTILRLYNDDIRAVEFFAPESLSDQGRVASILSAIDRKIALNWKRIATLEAMAKEIYDYWFVQFDFPDAHGRPYKSSGGAMVYNPDLKREIPKGWEVVPLGELISVCNGKDHKALLVGDIPVYGSGGIMRRVDQMLYEGESVLIPRKGTLNNIMYVNGPLWCIDTMFYTKPKVDNVMKYIFMTIKDWDFASMDTGSAVPSMTAGIINKLSVARPADVFLEKFENQMRALFVEMSLSEREIAKLTSLRSFLLPLLMNGQAKVR